MKKYSQIRLQINRFVSPVLVKNVPYRISARIRNLYNI